MTFDPEGPTERRLWFEVLRKADASLSWIKPGEERRTDREGVWMGGCSKGIPPPWPESSEPKGKATYKQASGAPAVRRRGAEPKIKCRLLDLKTIHVGAKKLHEEFNSTASNDY